MTEEIDKIGNQGKVFEFGAEDGIKSVKVFELTIKELAEIREIFLAAIKKQRREDAMEFSKELHGEEKIKYFVEVAKTTGQINEKDISDAFDSVFGMIEVLKMACRDPKIDWKELFKNNIENCMDAYLHALGLLVKESESFEEDKKKLAIE